MTAAVSDSAIRIAPPARVRRLHRRIDNRLPGYLFLELDHPKGAFLSTGTGVVPGQDFSLTHGDVVAITIGGVDGMTLLTLENEVAGKSVAGRAKVAE